IAWWADASGSGRRAPGAGALSQNRRGTRAASREDLGGVIARFCHSCRSPSAESRARPLRHGWHVPCTRLARRHLEDRRARYARRHAIMTTMQIGSTLDPLILERVADAVRQVAAEEIMPR